MRRHLYLLAAACFLLTLLPGCHTHKKYVESHASRKPRFINDIYISGHNKSSSTENAVAHTPTKKHTEKNTGRNSRDSYEDRSERVELDQHSLKKKYADILGVRTKEIDNTNLYRFIDRWYGTNYRLGGQDKEGIDCSGFAQKLYGEVYGVDLLRTAMEQFSSCKRVKHASDAEEGDLVFFHIHSKRITHVGVYLANNFFIHSSTSGGVIISNLNEDYWKKYYAGIGRVPKG